MTSKTLPELREDLALLRQRAAIVLESARFASDLSSRPSLRVAVLLGTLLRLALDAVAELAELLRTTSSDAEGTPAEVARIVLRYRCTETFSRIHQARRRLEPGGGGAGYLGVLAACESAQRALLEELGGLDEDLATLEEEPGGEAPESAPDPEWCSRPSFADEDEHDEVEVSALRPLGARPVWADPALRSNQRRSG